MFAFTELGKTGHQFRNFLLIASNMTSHNGPESQIHGELRNLMSSLIYHVSTHLNFKLTLLCHPIFLLNSIKKMKRAFLLRSISTICTCNDCGYFVLSAEAPKDLKGTFNSTIQLASS